MLIHNFMNMDKYMVFKNMNKKRSTSPTKYSDENWILLRTRTKFILLRTRLAKWYLDTDLIHPSNILVKIGMLLYVVICTSGRKNITGHK